MTKTLLLADDSVVIQKLVGLSFANEPVELITTDNGEDAVLRARETKPDVILADVVMPGRSGYEVCEAVKQDPELRDIPVLLLTGTFEAFDEERAQQVGSSGHITKPFEAQVLVDRVNELLEQAPAPEATASSATEESAPAPAAAAEAYEFFDEDPAPLAAAPVAAPVADTATVPAVGAATDFNANDNSFSFDNGPADLEPLDASRSFGRLPGAPASPEDEQGGDRTVAMLPGDPGAPTSSPSTTMDFDDLGATVLRESQPGITEPEAFSEPDLLAADDAFTPDDDPFSANDAFGPDEVMGVSDELGATRIVDDPFGDGQPDLSFRSEPGDPSISGMVDFGSESGPNPFASGDIDPGDTLLADDLFGESRSGISQSGATDPHGVTPASPIDDLDAGEAEAPLLESSQPGVEAIDAEAPIAEAPPIAPLAAFEAPAENGMESYEPMGVRDPMELRDPTRSDGPSDVEVAEPLLPPAPAADVASVSAPSLPDVASVSAPSLPDVGAVSAPSLPDVGAVSAPSLPDVGSVSAPSLADVASVSAPSLPDLSPMLRERLHESLEKIAWEAFADLSDQIVKQALERVEAVAWEVIPQMAEALIQEEIRRMKGEGEDE